MLSTIGIDTSGSAGNTKVDWKAAIAAGICFGFLRSEYGDSEDSTFRREWPRMLAAGIVRGGYLYLRHPRLDLGIKTVPEPEKQALAMLTSLRGYQPGDLPPTVDVEFSGRGRIDTGLTSGQLLDRVRRAVRVIRAELGVWPILYTSARVWRDDLSNLPAPDLIDCPLWLARYYVAAGPAYLGGPQFGNMPWPEVPKPWGAGGENNWLHQYQGNAVKCPGFNGKVDMNRFQMIQVGATGNRVRWIQKRLGILPEDGVFDASMGEVLKTFQEERGLVPDGIAGPRTFGYLAWQHV